MSVESPEVVVGSPERDIQVNAIVQLEKVGLSKNEEDEQEIYKMRAKLYRFVVDDEDGSQWKERGIGDIRILKNTKAGSFRLVMRRDQTLKLCLNHYLMARMEIRSHASSEKALLWSTPADYADGESKPETFCIRFGKAESTMEFKSKFEECVHSLTNEVKNKEDSDKLADDLSALNVKEEKDSNDNTTEVNKNVKSETKDAIENGEAEKKT